MPAFHKANLNDRVDPVTVGERVRSLREIRGLSREELARRSGISKTTLLRLERGLSTKDQTLTKVARALRISPPHLLLPDVDWQRPFHVHRVDDDQWYATAKLKERPEGYPPEANDPEERNRLAHLGYFGAYVKPLICMLRDVPMGVAVAEIYADHVRTMHHPGLEFVYMTRGEIILTIRDEEVHLREGEAITFWSEEPHNYRPVHPVPRGGLPPQCLMMVMEGASRKT